MRYKMSAQHKSRIGIMGGTFDPIHLGHLIVAEQARDQFDLEKILLMPSGHSYFKDNRAWKVTDSNVRLEMTKLAAYDQPGFEVSAIEVQREGNSYTCDTLQQLSELHPDVDYYYIVGADTIMSMRLWRKPKAIFDRCVVLAAIRDDQVPEDHLKAEIEALGRDFGAVIHLLSVPNIGISSTDIRKRASEGRSIHYMVPEAVERYIMKTGIYNGKQESAMADRSHP